MSEKFSDSEMQELESDYIVEQLEIGQIHLTDMQDVLDAIDLERELGL